MTEPTTDSQHSREIILHGKAASPGIVIGPVFLHQDALWQPEKCSIPAERVPEQLLVFQGAVKAVHKQLHAAWKKMAAQYGEDLAEVLQMQISLLEDQFFLQEVEQFIEAELYDAAYAAFFVFGRKKELFLAMSDEYFQDRAFDIHSLKKQLVQQIRGVSNAINLQAPAVVLAANLSPAETVHLHHQQVLGFVTSSGGKNSHTAIVARSLGVPAVVGVHNICEAAKGARQIILDGSSGRILLNPSAASIADYEKRREMQHARRAQLLQDAALESTTLDGRRVFIQANIEFKDELEATLAADADGIGLFRTEGIFLERSNLPSEEEQAEVYSEIARRMYPREVVIRTLDIGGDKILPDLIRGREDNPFLGWRAIRFWLDHKTGFLAQLKAILRANTQGNVKILLPMISGLDEIRQIRQLLEEARQQLREKQIPFGEEIQLGIMVEIPSVVLLADVLAKEVDFFSIGTNDLVQYTLAVDRGNEKVARLYSHFHPAILRMLKQTMWAAREAGIPVTICGEMAGDPRAVPLLLALELNALSASNMVIPQLKKMVRELSLEQCRQFYLEVEKLTTTEEVKQAVESFYLQHFPDMANGRLDGGNL